MDRRLTDEFRRILVAPDSYKGSLTSVNAAKIIRRAILSVKPQCVVDILPIGDGGDGTLDAYLYSCGGASVLASVHDPNWRVILSRYGVVDSNTAIIEMAMASGITLVKRTERNCMRATSYGTGELIKHAIGNGKKRIFVTIGGSATVDGGMGCAIALGYKFLDRNGEELFGCGESLAKVVRIDASESMITDDVEIVCLCDVKNPLIGECGAVYGYAEQKGANEKQKAILEAGMVNYCKCLSDYADKSAIDVAKMDGGGAAGGMGAMMKVLLGAKMKPGIETMLDVCGFDDRAKQADLVITGEGNTDAQTIIGKKAVFGITSRCKKLGVPSLVVSGMHSNVTCEQLLCCDMITLIRANMKVSYSVEHAESLLYEVIASYFSEKQ